MDKTILPKSDPDSDSIKLFDLRSPHPGLRVTVYPDGGNRPVGVCRSMTLVVRSRKPDHPFPRVQLIQSTLYKTDLSHRSTTKTAIRSNLTPTAYHICTISSLKLEANALIPQLGHAEKNKTFSYAVIPRSSSGRRPRGLPLDA